MGYLLSSQQASFSENLHPPRGGAWQPQLSHNPDPWAHLTPSGPISPILSSGKLELGLYAVETVGLLNYSDGEVGAEAAMEGRRCSSPGILKWREGWKKAAHKCNDRTGINNIYVDKEEFRLLPHTTHKN